MTSFPKFLPSLVEILTGSDLAATLGCIAWDLGGQGLVIFLGGKFMRVRVLDAPRRVVHRREDTRLHDRSADAKTFDDAGGLPRSVLMVASSGGHLSQLLALEPWWASRQRSWVTFKTEDAVSRLRAERDENVVWAHHPTTRNIPNLIRNLFLAIRVLVRERPDVIVSTGAGVAFPFFLFARFIRIPTVYLEVYDRIDTPTLTGRLCRPFASRFCVQWDEQRALYKDAHVVGPVL